jgi:chromate transporter
VTRHPRQQARDAKAGGVRDLALYFLRLGALGFGGPIALAGRMREDLVDDHGWFTESEYKEGLALAQLCPGPLAAQLAMYLGWLRGGAAGAALIGGAFIAPSLLLVIVLAALYVRFGGLGWIESVFYGVGAAVIALVVKGAIKLAQTSLARDALLWTLAAISAAVTAITETEVISLFVVAGLIVVLVRERKGTGGPLAGLPMMVVPPLLVTGIHGAAPPGTLVQIAWFFTKAGASVFGSGLAIVPFLHGGVVKEFHWLDEQQFRDAVAVAMITPGPVVITSGFIGYLTSGLLGALVATAGTFIPPWLVVVLAARPLRHPSPRLRAFVSGVTAAAAGAIAGAAVVLGRRALVDVTTVLLAVGTLGGLLRWKRVPEPIWVLAAGGAGFVARHLGTLW